MATTAYERRFVLEVMVKSSGPIDDSFLKWAHETLNEESFAEVTIESVEHHKCKDVAHEIAVEMIKILSDAVKQQLRQGAKKNDGR